MFVVSSLVGCVGYIFWHMIEDGAVYSRTYAVNVTVIIGWSSSYIQAGPKTIEVVLIFFYVTSEGSVVDSLSFFKWEFGIFPYPKWMASWVIIILLLLIYKSLLSLWVRPNVCRSLTLANVVVQRSDLLGSLHLGLYLNSSAVGEFRHEFQEALHRAGLQENSWEISQCNLKTWTLHCFL